MGKTYDTVRDMIVDVFDDPEVVQQFDEEVRATRIITNLMLLRNLANLTQRELAQRMGCDPSKISKMEASEDAQLRWGDIAAYCAALGVEPSVLFETPSLPADYRLRQYAKDLGRLAANLAALLEEEGRTSLADKTHRFTSEVLFILLQAAETGSVPTSRAAEPEREYKGKRS